MGKNYKKSEPTTKPKNKSKTMSFTISIEPFNYRKFSSSEIGRGIYISKAGKGKGSYNRKTKHKKSYGYIYFINLLGIITLLNKKIATRLIVFHKLTILLF